MSALFDALQTEFERLNLLLHREILRARAAYQLSLDEFRGLYISDEQVDQLIEQISRDHGDIPTAADLTGRAEALRRSRAARHDAPTPWQRLAAEFALSDFETDVLLLALAPTFDLKYETLCAYLNNDVARKWPTCDLALRLFAATPSDRLTLRRYLQPNATLFRAGLLQPLPPSPDRPSWLAAPVALAPPLAEALMGLPARHPRLAECAEWRHADARWEDLALPAELCGPLRRLPALIASSQAQGPAPIIVFEGQPGSLHLQVAAAVGRDLGLTLLRLDLGAMQATGEPWERLLAWASLQQRLDRAAIYFDQGAALFGPDGHTTHEHDAFVRGLSALRPPLFFACEPGVPWRDLFGHTRCVAFAFGTPEPGVRRRLWATALHARGLAARDADLDALAARFGLTPGQIDDAVASAADLQGLHEEPAAAMRFACLAEAARRQSGDHLGRLAVKVNPIFTWDDLVLPLPTLRQVKEIAAAIRVGEVVYGQWGFRRRVAGGCGLKVLFAGSSGTGKTMTASVVARDLGLDLYKIDLAGLVSKYIGETEKNLDRVFRAARNSHAILFFDEADALFGKRSEVKDAHDRYANIEVAYLLQQLEEHDGAVILASNLSKNIDAAFARRMHYVVDYPLPDERLRLRLWQRMFTADAPLGEDVDFPFLAKQFALPGGDIKNVALDAAFLAAQDCRVIRMKHLVRAMARQLMKQGRSPQTTDFKQYHALIAPE